MTLVGIAVGVAAAGGEGGGGVRPHAEGRTVLCIPAIDPPITHHVGTGCIWVVCWAPILARYARVGVINITTMSMSVVPILPMIAGNGRVCGLLSAGTIATKPGWLLETPTTVATTTTVVVVASAVASDGNC